MTGNVSRLAHAVDHWSTLVRQSRRLRAAHNLRAAHEDAHETVHASADPAQAAAVHAATAPTVSVPAESQSASGAGRTRSQTGRGTAREAVTNGVVLSNPAANEYAVQFVIGDEVASLPAGGRMRFQAVGPIAIRFDRGADFGTWEGQLQPGRHYRFAVDARGWRLEEASGP